MPKERALSKEGVRPSNRAGNSPTLTTTLSFLSFRAKPRNLLCAIRVPRIYRSTTTFLCHPERSASQIYRERGVFRREVDGPRRCLLADALRTFPPPTSDGSCPACPNLP